MPPQYGETNEYYKQAFDLVFKLMGYSAYISVGRWSYARDVTNPRVFTLGGVGGMDRNLEAILSREFESKRFRSALKDFSLTKLLADSDQEVWFHFTNENPPHRGEDQVYLGRFQRRETRIIEVAAREVTPELVHRIIDIFEIEMGVTQYGGVALRDKAPAIADTLEAAIFSLFATTNSAIKHITFMPVVVKSTSKNVVGIISINTSEHLKVAELEPILQPFAEGIMAPFHSRETDEQRRWFANRTAIAAIMSRNMSHNIGSHVLWHLSQQLKGQ